MCYRVKAAFLKKSSFLCGKVVYTRHARGKTMVNIVRICHVEISYRISKIFA